MLDMLTHLIGYVSSFFERLASYQIVEGVSLFAVLAAVLIVGMIIGFIFHKQVVIFMSLEQFLFDLDSVLDFIFGIWDWIWTMVISNWVVMLSVSVSLLSLVVLILKRIRNIKPQEVLYA